MSLLPPNSEHVKIYLEITIVQFLHRTDCMGANVQTEQQLSK